jgi:hypothetical protein
MSASAPVVFARLLPVLFVTFAAIAYAAYVEGPNAYAVRNSVPMLIVLLLAAVVLIRGGGRWTGRGVCWVLGTIGFAIPALGLSLYLHYGYATDLNGMYSEAVFPQELFRYLPIYTIVAGGIGFAIGWIIGRNA